MAVEISGIHQVAIRVTDLERAREFYVGTLGFAHVLDLPGGFIVNAGGSLIGIRGGAPETASGDRFDPFRVGLDHLSLAVSEPALEGLLRNLEAQSIPNHGLERDDVLGTTHISFYDPDGIAWELYAMPG